MFPAIREAWREFRSGFGAGPEPLSLKEAAIGFDPTSIAWYARNGYPGLYSMLGHGGPSWSGESIDANNALNLSVVWACTRIISESLAFLPASLMQRRNGVKREAAEHPAYALVHDEPNSDMSDMEFRETLTAHCVGRGNGYSRVLRRSSTGTAIGLLPLLPNQITPDRDKQQNLVYVVKDGNDQEKAYTVLQGKPQDILHVRGLGFDGVQGYSVITLARQSLGTSQGAEKYAAKFYANGGRVPYVLETATRFKSDEDFKKFRNDWDSSYSGSDNFHKAPILENGLTYKQIGFSPEDAQFIATRQFNIPEQCRWFRVSPHLVGDLSRATFANIEQLALEFVQMTLMAWIVRWEKALRRCVLTPQEKDQGYYFKLNANGLLRGDFQSRMAGYATALQNGHMSINEVRDLEDRNPIDGGDDFHIQLNMQSLPGGTPTASQQAALVKVGGTQK